MLAHNLLKQRRHEFRLVSLTTPDSDGVAFALPCAADALISSRVYKIVGVGFPSSCETVKRRSSLIDRAPSFDITRKRKKKNVEL
jgi:hypothetical protein